jgi:hypothetical protein
MAKILMIGDGDDECILRMTRNELHSTFAYEEFADGVECTPLVKGELIHALQRALGRVEVAATILEKPSANVVEVKGP